MSQEGVSDVLAADLSCDTYCCVDSLAILCARVPLSFLSAPGGLDKECPATFLRPPSPAPSWLLHVRVDFNLGHNDAFLA